MIRSVVHNPSPPPPPATATGDDALVTLNPDRGRCAVRPGCRCRPERVACPGAGLPGGWCSGRLRPWSPARTRTVTVRGGERVRLTPDRGRCERCRVSQTLLPAW